MLSNLLALYRFHRRGGCTTRRAISKTLATRLQP